MTKIFEYTICCMVFCITFNSCCDRDVDLSLPEITTSGLNTFGCYVDDILFVYSPGSGVLGDSPINGTYHEEINTLGIFSHAKKNLFISLIDSIVEVGKTYELSDALFRDNNTWYDLCKDMPSELCILKLDLENNIACGTFQFKARNPESGVIKTITNGRFDIKMSYTNFGLR